MRQESKLKNAGGERVGERGSALVEFALAVVLLFTMVFGILDFGRALYTYHFLSNAAREATRWAAVNGADCHLDLSCPYASGASKDDVTTYVKSITPPGIDASQLQVTTCGTQGQGECAGSTPATCATTVNAPGCAVQVEVSYNFNFLVPVVHNGSITMSSSSEMTISH